MEDENVRKPDETKREVLIPTNIENNDMDDDLKTALNNSMESYNDEYTIGCQETVIEKQIQMLLQKEYDVLKNGKEERKEELSELMIRLQRIDKDGKYYNMIKKYINDGEPLLYDNYVELIDFIKKPSIVSIIIEHVRYRNH